MNHCISNPDCGEIRFPCHEVKRDCYYHICHPQVSPGVYIKTVFMNALHLSVCDLAKATCIPVCEWNKILCDNIPLNDYHIDVLVRVFNTPEHIWKGLQYNYYAHDKCNSKHCWSRQIEY